MRVSSGKSRFKKALASIYLSNLSSGVDTELGNPSSISHDYGQKDSPAEIKALRELGLISNSSSGSNCLTESGRKEITVVMAGGSFDIIHPGHIETLEKAKALGDVLVVSVARDITYEHNKSKKPLHDEKLRRKMVDSIKCVDAAILGSEVDIFKTVEVVSPDIIALGYDQSHDVASFKEELSRRGLHAKVVRLDSSVPEIKTSRIAKDYY